MNTWQPCCERINERTGICSIHGRYGDLELEQRALGACGYRVHVKERNGTRWLMAVKGLGVRYEHWHPLTNINQAMQLLCECGSIEVVDCVLDGTRNLITSGPLTAHELLTWHCRAIVTACASLKPVR